MNRTWKRCFLPFVLLRAAVLRGSSHFSASTVIKSNLWKSIVRNLKVYQQTSIYKKRSSKENYLKYIIVEHLKISNHRSFLYLFSKIKLHLKNILAKIPKRSSLTWDFPKLLKRATMSRLTRMNDFCKKLQLYPKRSFYVLLSNQVPINYFF